MTRRRLALVLLLLFVSTLGLAPTATAAVTAQATEVHVVQLKSAPLRITPAGGVRVVMWSKCSPAIQPFEFNVSVYQGSVVSSKSLTSSGGDEMPTTCDGTRHRIVVTVPRPASGRFYEGLAQIEVYVAAYNSADQTDLDASDSTFAQLYRP
jgi:hypothetical protein